MRIALISDIHGHLDRLQAVFADLAAQGGAERIISLGDCCFFGPEPAATLRLLRARCDAWIPGNHDLDLLDPARIAASPEQDRADLERTLADLSDDDLAFLRSWPCSLRVALPGGGELLAFHALPEDPYFPLAQDGAPIDAFSARFVPHRARVLAAGHTHVQLQRQLPDGTLFINPGSAGVPLTLFPWDPARSGIISECHYAILKAEPDGGIEVRFRRLPRPA
jgi:predicted phosphodiesterase